MQGSHRNAAFPPLSRCGRRKLLLASHASPPHRDKFILTRQSWSYPLTSCVSPNSSTLQIHLQSQLQLPEVLFHLKQPTAVQAGLPPALPLRKPTVPVAVPLGMAGTRQHIPLASTGTCTAFLLLSGSGHLVLAYQGHK